MAIRKISLRNFRGFLDAEIEVKPLTVLMGPNSAGKSSFGHALAAMSHAHRVYSRSAPATLTPSLATRDYWPVDLGTLEDLRTKAATGPVTVGIETDSGLIETGFGIDSVPSLLPAYLRYPKPETTDTRLQTTLFPDSANVSASGTIFVGPTSTEAGATTARGTHCELVRRNEQQWFERISTQSGFQDIPSVVALNGLLLDSITHLEGTSVPLSGRARDQFKFQLENLAYLRATRRRPSRSYPRPSAARDPNSPQQIGYGGEWAASVIEEYSKEQVEYAELPRIPNSPEEARASLGRKPEIITRTLLESATHWLSSLDLAASLRSVDSKSHVGHLEILLRVPDQEEERELIDIGFGASQVLPVLVEGLLQQPDSLFVVDLPEAHLHPRPQTALADFFCSLALTNRYCLVETHSEMFFHRLRLRAEMDEELKNKIAVYFIDRPTGNVCRQPRRVGVGLDEQFRWPAGFLQEAWEAEEQIEAVRHGKKSRTMQ
jgi:predicted ATPase